MSKVLGIGAAAAAIAAILPAAIGISPAAAAAAAAVAAPAAGGDIAAFYRSRGGAPLWFAPGAGNARQQLLQLLATAHADNLNPRRYNAKGLARAVGEANRGNPAAVQRAEAMLSAAFVAYVRDQKHDPRIGIFYVDPELKPSPPSAVTLLGQAAHAPSLSEY